MLLHRLWGVTEATSVTVSYIGYATASGSAGTITIPSSAQSGDLAVLIDRDSSAAPENIVPSGWTQISNLYLSSSGQSRVILSCKLLGASDPGSTITGMGGGLLVYKVMMVFRFSTAPTSLFINSVNEQITDSSPSAQDVPWEESPYVVLGACGSSAAPGWADTWYDAQRLNSYVRLGYKLFNGLGSDVTVDSTDTGFHNSLQSCSIVPSFS